MKGQPYNVSVETIQRTLESDPHLIESLKSDPIKGMENLISTSGTPLQTDAWIYRIVVSGLAITVLSCTVASSVLAMYDKEIPDALIGLGTGALGAIAGLIAPSPSE
ncbi:hypothetical protein [Acaryochloris marina]|uniref:hypothetical protein n=1 Tax=Acaryochloris marina TaxID=155978 RepID=UPI0021C30D16|nr:hypothetical protein [Acaryochloris marina]BDM77180.1 hypothetical protein AM10699_00540 [Acaryochloris marina MBIC10699]